ncbi:uncharacterized protein LOC122358280 [Puntigrus tetrazona]|uniref:uncharacterized protein LOC122358280 n=1 Tax=Puntigrus tetrazona TaxID=1606681 RepID=UPI001C8A91FC|nr:uncharacterized protein LOC122358280 [Puntigrus tetrazona]
MENEPLLVTQESSSTSTESSSSTQKSTAPGVLKRRRPCCAALHSQYQGFLESLAGAESHPRGASGDPVLAEHDPWRLWSLSCSQA